MPDGRNNHMKHFINILKLTVAVFSVLIIASCPEPMSDNLLAEVEDVVAPQITITTPDLSIQYFIESTITIEGNIVDFSDINGDIPGSIVSATYSDEYGFLNVNGDIIFDSNGDFIISFSGLTLTDTFKLIFTVIDWNNNVSTFEMTLWVDDSGPFILIDNYDSDEDYYHSSLLAETYTITGQVGTDTSVLQYKIEWSEGANLPDTTIYPDASGNYSLDFLTSDYPLGSINVVLTALDSSLNTNYLVMPIIDDPYPPTLGSYTFPSDNNTLTIAIAPSNLPADPNNDGLYTTAAGATGSNAVTEADFDLLLDGLPLTWSFSTAPAEAAESFIINFTGIPATPDGTEILTFAPKADAVFDRIGNPANLAVFLITENLHDKQVPTVSSVTQIDATHVVVVFSEDVIEAQAVTFAYYSNPDTPSIPATNAVLAGGDTVTLTFGSAIDPGAGLNIDGGVINDLDGNPLAIVTGHFIIDAVSPTIESIDSSSPDGSYNALSSIPIVVHFDELVTLTGTATLGLNSSGVTTATCVGPVTNSNTLTFTYDIQTGDEAGILTVTSITGAIQDGIGNDLDPALPAGNNLGDNGAIVIDAVDPTITSIVSTDLDGSYNASDSITIVVHFDELVTLTGTATLGLNSSGVTTATCVGPVTNSSTLTFTYDIQTGDEAGILTVTSITGGIQDGIGNSLDPALPIGSNLGNNNIIEIDNTAPELVSVVLVDNGSPGADDGDTIIFNFNDEIALGSLVANDTPDDPNDLIDDIGLIAVESGFTNSEATSSTLVISGNAITITLQGVAADEHDRSMPEGIFTPNSNLEDLAGNPIIVAVNPNEVVVSGSWDETLPTITSVSALPSSLSTGSITVIVTYLEPIVTFTESANITVFNTSNADITNTLDDGSWNVDKTEFTKIYTIGTPATGTSATLSGTFTVSVNGATDIYGNVQTALGSNIPVNIFVP